MKQDNISFVNDLGMKARGILMTDYYLCCSDSGEVLTQMSAGDFFVEIGILNLDGGVNR